MQSVESLQMQREFEIVQEIELNESGELVDSACSTEVCPSCDGVFDHTEMVYCDSCNYFFDYSCYAGHLDENPECKLRNGE